ncbi:MAG: FAD-dependent oxidoreductase [Patescibacteria group bacterium]|nr:FAD-dependent oxidoreductase [Patescibacteria group bacterium]
METYKYLIIGGGIAGTTAAETLRKEDPEARVAIISDEPYPLYSRILLSKPNFFLEKVPFDTIWMRKAEGYKEKGIDFIGGRRATTLNAKDKTVTLDDGTELKYEKLLLAIGCPVRQLPIPGLDKKGVNHVKTVDDARDIITNVKKAQTAVVIGSGFIGFEMCDMLHLAGVKVEAIVREKYFWEPILDEPAGRILERKMVEEGINIRLESEVTEVRGDERVEGVTLKDGTEIDCQMIILAVGVNFKGEWLKSTGLEIRRGILADEKLKTNLADIWTAGDVAEFQDVLLDECLMCGTWINAQMQGKTAAMNMMGKDETYRQLSFYTAHGFGFNIGFVGNVWLGDDSELIGRGDPGSGKYTGIVLRGGNRIVGSFMIDRPGDMTPLKRFVESKADVSGIKEKLANPDTDLATLIGE